MKLLRKVLLVSVMVFLSSVVYLPNTGIKALSMDTDIFKDTNTGNLFKGNITSVNYTRSIHTGQEFVIEIEIENITSSTVNLDAYLGEWLLCMDWDYYDDYLCESNVEILIDSTTNGVRYSRGFGASSYFESSYILYMDNSRTLEPGESFNFRINAYASPSIFVWNNLDTFVSGFNFYGRDRLNNLILLESEIQEKTIDFSISYVPGQIQVFKLQSVLRLYNAATGSHLYTKERAEYDGVLKGRDNFYGDGRAFYGYSEKVANTIPVYRFYNANTGSHFYTSNAAEKRSVETTLAGYYYEGIAYYVYPSQLGGSKPLYRFYNANSSSHFYTTSSVERDNVKNNLSGYFYEGIAYYVL